MHVKTAKELRAMDLEDLGIELYDRLKSMGMLWVYFPEASGSYEEDMKRIDQIGQNGNDGSHYDEDKINYRVSGADNPDGLDWPHRWEDGYAEKIEKLYNPPKDDLFVDDYTPCRGHDMVSNPKHYMLSCGVEVIDVINSVLTSQEAVDWLTPYEGGQYTGVIERILRAPKKNKLEDLQKAHKQLGWLIQSLEGA